MKTLRNSSLLFALLLMFAVGDFSQLHAQDSLHISILGDSYSTFEGWLSPKGNNVWYFPADSKTQKPANDVDRVEQTWWYQVIEGLGGKLEKNNSFSGATICFTGYKHDTSVNGDYTDRAFITRMSNLGDPDVILICGGTNDSWCGAPIGEYKWDRWTRKDLYSFRPAMAKLCAELPVLYPEAKILFILNSELKPEINESVHTICEHYNMACLDLRDIDKQHGHPSIAGMKAFARQVLEALNK